MVDGFDVTDGKPMLRQTISEFFQSVESEMWGVLQYCTGMILKELKSVELNEFNEVPEEVQKRLQVLPIYNTALFLPLT